MGDPGAAGRAASESLRSPPTVLTGVTGGRRGHAVVLGGRVAGLLAARVLSDRYERVTIIDRGHCASQLDRGRVGWCRPARLRAGSPVLILEAPVLDALDRLWPGMSVELTAVGARLAAAPRTLFATRVFVERHLRRRLVGQHDVRFLLGHDVVGLRADGHRCAGVWVLSQRLSAATRGVVADLVVDAMGPRSRLTHWLANRWSTVVPIERPGLRRYECQVLRLHPGGGTEPLARGPFEPPYEWMITGVEHGCHVLAVSQPDGARPASTDHLDPMTGRRLGGALALAGRRGVPEAAPCVFHVPCLARRRFDLAEGMPSGVMAVGGSLQQADPLSGADLEFALRHLDVLASC